MRVKIAEAEDMDRGRGIHEVLEERLAQVDAILEEHGANVNTKNE